MDMYCSYIYMYIYFLWAREDKLKIINNILVLIVKEMTSLK